MSMIAYCSIDNKNKTKFYEHTTPMLASKVETAMAVRPVATNEACFDGGRWELFSDLLPERQDGNETY